MEPRKPIELTADEQRVLKALYDHGTMTWGALESEHGPAAPIQLERLGYIGGSGTITLGPAAPMCLTQLGRKMYVERFLTPASQRTVRYVP